jgi:hypothetical protein
MSKGKISFIVTVSDDNVLKQNLLSSPIYRPNCHHEIIIRHGFNSASLAYNDAMDRANNDLMVFLHQDVFLPEGWDEKLFRIIYSLEEEKIPWGVLGSFGITLDGQPAGHLYTNGLGKVLGSSKNPIEVQSLDEVVIVMKKSSGLQFDVFLPGFHLYGTDICFEAKKIGLKCFAISNFCYHNSLPVLRLRSDFWRCAEYIRLKWKSYLPVTTPCITIMPGRMQLLFSRLLSMIGYIKELKYKRLKERVDLSRIMSELPNQDINIPKDFKISIKR